MRRVDEREKKTRLQMDVAAQVEDVESHELLLELALSSTSEPREAERRERKRSMTLAWRLDLAELFFDWLEERIGLKGTKRGSWTQADLDRRRIEVERLERSLCASLRRAEAWRRAARALADEESPQARREGRRG